MVMEDGSVRFLDEFDTSRDSYGRDSDTTREQIWGTLTSAPPATACPQITTCDRAHTTSSLSPTLKGGPPTTPNVAPLRWLLCLRIKWLLPVRITGHFE